MNISRMLYRAWNRAEKNPNRAEQHYVQHDRNGKLGLGFGNRIVRLVLIPTGHWEIQ